jgi:hypothetical protein
MPSVGFEPTIASRRAAVELRLRPRGHWDRWMTKWRMHIACWIPKAANTPSQYVILTAVPLQLWLYERVLTLPDKYIVLFCLP